jgi:uncharacterized iron-regulated protein
MKNYRIVSHHDIHVDDYENGEGEYLNGYSLEEIIAAESPIEAVEKYFKNVLAYDFDKDSACIDDEQDNVLHYDVLVDDNNFKASESEIEEWKNGKKVLYNDHSVVYVYELTPVKL